MRGLLTRALPLVFAASLAAAMPAHASFPGQNGKIAFVSDRDGNSEIYSMNADGTALTRLTTNAAVDDAPAWSPDGRQIAFASDRDGQWAIYVMSADGSNVRKIANIGISPAWSPDGTRIAFTHGAAVAIVNSDGSPINGQPQVELGIGYDPDWSPDGSKIAFVRFFNQDTQDIFVMNADGTGATNLTATSGSEHDEMRPSWSPDGSRIAFTDMITSIGDPENPTDEVAVMNSNGLGRISLTPGAFEDGSPSWSPDGTKIAFRSWRNFPSGRQIYVMDATGTNQTRITNDAANYFDPSWQRVPAPASPAPTYEHPSLASPLRFALVPVFRQCGTTANPTDGQHSPPLSIAACLPPAPQGVARFGAQAAGTAWIAVIYGDTNVTNGDQADMTLRFDLTDIRTGTGADYNPNPGGADGTFVIQLRITDRANGPSGTAPGTTTNLDFPAPFSCTPTSDPALGSTCALDTSADALNPGMIKENKASVVQVYRLRLNDSGANAVRGDSDDRVFATEGVYVP